MAKIFAHFDPQSMLLGISGKEMAVFTGMDGLVYVPIPSCSREEVKQPADTGGLERQGSP